MSYRPDQMRYGNIHPNDYANWGYIILYLVVILASVLGNSLFLATIKKCQQFRRTHHLFLAVVAIRDLIVTIAVVPFVIDSQAVNLMQWKSGDIMCKLFSFLHYGTMSSHAFLLVFLLLFLYFWYRKQEAYMTEDGTTVVRQTKMHKWAIPLAWVIGLGLAIPAGALASVNLNQNTGIQSCAIWDGRGSSSNGYKVAVSNVFVSFLVPLLIIIFPFIALLMQVCGGREPRLDPPHNRNAMTALALGVIFVGTRAPFEVYELMKLFQHSGIGLKANPTWGTPYAYWTFETDIVLNAIIFVACALHPIVYFALNPEYRAGLVTVWKTMSCNQTPAERVQQMQMQQQKRANPRQYPNNGSGPIIKNNRAPNYIRGGQEPLLQGNQPQIMASAAGQPQYYPYPQGYQYIQQQPGVVYPQPGPQYLFPDHALMVPSFDNSFERTSPLLPAVFEYDGLKYIDTARVEPRKAYSPEKTPPKTPETPHFSHTPFVPPTQNMIINPDPVWPAVSRAANNQTNQSFDMPIATSEKKPSRAEGFEMETLDGSPGNTLRERNRRIASPPTSPVQDLDEDTRVEMLQESPGSRNRRRQSENQPPPKANRTNGNHNAMGSRPISPNSAAAQDNVEIVITGRTRSRQDLCPEVPKSKFEHAV